ncbi:non-ribosomal peptide synthase [Sesbania bispinosa]|nr:non-ribosomal peptide synthase [Sesbania bispinosa]
MARVGDPMFMFPYHSKTTLHSYDAVLGGTPIPIVHFTDNPAWSKSNSNT